MAVMPWREPSQAQVSCMDLGSVRRTGMQKAEISGRNGPFLFEEAVVRRTHSGTCACVGLRECEFFSLSLWCARVALACECNRASFLVLCFTFVTPCLGALACASRSSCPVLFGVCSSLLRYRSSHLCSYARLCP
jgi:hypothetical protein